MTKSTERDEVRFSLRTKLFLLVLVSFGVLTLAIILHVRREEGTTQYERFADLPRIRNYHPSVPAGTRYVQECQEPADA